MRVDPVFEASPQPLPVDEAAQWEVSLSVMPSFVPGAEVVLTRRADGQVRGLARVGLGPSRRAFFKQNPDACSDYEWFMQGLKPAGALVYETPLNAAELNVATTASSWVQWLNALPAYTGGVMDGAGWVWTLTTPDGLQQQRKTRRPTDEEVDAMNGLLAAILDDDDLCTAVCDRWSRR